MMDKRRMELLRVLSTDVLLEMINTIEELDDDMRQIALEEIVQVLYEREVKQYE